MLYEVQTIRCYIDTLTYHIEAESGEEAKEIVESNNCPEPIHRRLDWDGEPDEVIDVDILEGEKDGRSTYTD